MSKLCSHCKVIKEDSAFYSRGGIFAHLLTSWCKTCSGSEERLAAQRARNIKYYKGTLKQSQKDDPRSYLHKIAKSRAKRSGIEFSITSEDIILNEYCPLSGVKLEVNSGNIKTSMSLDRVDNNKGYIPGNVVIISREFNLRKGDLTLFDLEKLIEYIKRYSS